MRILRPQVYGYHSVSSFQGLAQDDSDYLSRDYRRNPSLAQVSNRGMRLGIASFNYTQYPLAHNLEILNAHLGFDERYYLIIQVTPPFST